MSAACHMWENGWESVDESDCESDCGDRFVVTYRGHFDPDVRVIPPLPDDRDPDQTQCLTGLEQLHLDGALPALSKADL